MDQEKVTEIAEAVTAEPAAPVPEKESAGKKAWDIISTILVALIVMAAVFLVGMRLVGLNAYTVLSNSMKPTYYTGDLIFVKKVTPSPDLKGKPITFVLNDKGTVATHRVVKVTKDEKGELWFKTKGDNNKDEDGGKGVNQNNIKGTPVFRIPLLGYVANFIQTPPGSYITIGAVALMLILVFLPDLFKSGKKTDTPAPTPPKAE